MRWVVLALLLLAAPAYAAAPSVGNTGVGTSTGVSTQDINVTTTHAPSVIIMTILHNTQLTTSRTVSSVTDQGSAGLTFTKRTSSKKDNGACNGQATCSIAVELWWAPVASNVTNETIRVTWSGANFGGEVGWAEVYGLLSTAAPFDQNASLPVTANVASGTMAFSGLTTSAQEVLLVSAFATGQNTGGTPCYNTLTNWNAFMSGAAFTSIQGSGVTQGFTTARSAAGSNYASAAPACDAGDSYGFITAIIVDALAATAPAPSCTQRRTLLGAGQC